MTPPDVRAVRVSKLPPDVLAMIQATSDEWVLRGMSARDRRRWLARRKQREEQWAVQRELRGMLRRYPWEWFGHLTFKTCESLSYAKRAVRRYFHLLSRVAWGRRYWKRTDEGLFAFVAFERQKRGDWHAHFLAAGTCGMSQFDAMQLWSERHGWARIFVYDPTRGGAGYATKYATKEIDGDYSLIGRWREVEGLPLLRAHGKA